MANMWFLSIDRKPELPRKWVPKLEFENQWKKGIRLT